MMLLPVAPAVRHSMRLVSFILTMIAASLTLWPQVASAGEFVEALRHVAWHGPHMDTYCERRGPGLWDEPVNALTNLCIIASGFFILHLYLRDIVAKYHRHYPMFLGLIGLVIALGTGSLIWHTYANAWALWADLVPIVALIFAYQWAILRLVFRWSRREVWAYLVIFTLVNVGLTSAFGEEALNGSIIYLPAVSALVWFGWRMKHERKRGARYMSYGVAIFVLAILLRTLDMKICPYFPIGTHFFWHVGNSFLVYLLAKALIHGYAGGGTRRPFMGAQPPKRRKAKLTM